MVEKSLGFSLWCDFVERSFLNEGFKDLIEKNIINGATSNPAIFKSAFLTSEAYKEDKEKLQGEDPKKVYEELAVKDIQEAADKLFGLHQKEDDGFISIEVDPYLCDDAKGTIEEGKRLYEKIGKKNVMIKVPATEAGFEAMEELMAFGINVNATLIFSPSQALGCLEAFKKANEKFQKEHKGSKLPKAVISIFVSRFDRKMDSLFAQKDIKTGKLGIFNASKIYDLIESYGLPNVRALFASTGVKGDEYPKEYYVKELLYKNSINTAPLGTIEAFVQKGDFGEQAKVLKEEYQDFFTKLKDEDIKIENIYDELTEDAIKSFKEAFDEIMKELT